MRHILSSLRKLELHQCQTCHHIIARHLTQADATKDYHLQYDQHDYLKSLSQTRNRQAEEILNNLRAILNEGKLLDIGCGRAFLLRLCLKHDIPFLAGADTSSYAIESLESSGLEAIHLKDSTSPPRVSFQPRLISLLDVVEHFEADKITEHLNMLSSFFPEVGYMLIKVPVSSGVIFRLAEALARLGLESFINSMFQIGTEPPHYHYFSKTSAQLLLMKLKFQPEKSWDDPDFEKWGMASRMNLHIPILKFFGNIIGLVLFELALLFKLGDSYIVLGKKGSK